MRSPNTRHGKHKHPLYTVHANMIARCTDPDSESYGDYGGRGIGVCSEWMKSLPAFIAYCEAHGWKPGLEIDRYPNNDGNYKPGNVRFVTRKINCRNRRSNLVVSVRGEELPLVEAVERFGVAPYNTTLFRYQNLGWDIERALTEQATPGSRPKTHCKRGHLFTDDSVFIHHGRRCCRECARDANNRRQREYRAARKAANA